MKSVIRPLPKKVLNETNVHGVMVVSASAGEKPLGAIYKLRNGRFEAVPYDDHRIVRFDDPHAAQRHIEKCKLEV